MEWKKEKIRTEGSLEGNGEERRKKERRNNKQCFYIGLLLKGTIL
jgi:hypothetical protein